MLKISYLTSYKPKNLKDIDSSMLGWVRPDKTINFQTKEAADIYAKNRVLQALKCKSPFERGLIIDNNRILAEFNGNKNSVMMTDIIPTLTQGKKFVHGHPPIYAFGETPLSFEDYMNKITHKFSQFTAYNEKGEFNTIESLPPRKITKLLPKKIIKLLDFLKTVGEGSTIVSRYAKMYSSLFPEDLQEPVQQLFHFNQPELLADKKLAKEGQKVLMNPDLYRRIEKIERQIFNDGTAAKKLDEFWKNNAKEFRYIYTSNFSHLKNVN